MNRYELLELLGKNTLKIVFTKTDGTEREMHCTLDESVVPPYEKKGTKKSNEDVIPVWDIDLSAWRSFRVDSVKLVEVIA